MTDTDTRDGAPTLDLVRRTHRTIDPMHAVVYFAPEAAEAYEAAGVSGAAGYFASRSAALGVVPSETIAATFFNFNPELVATAMQHAWDTASPSDVLAARYDAVDRAYRRLLGEAALESDAMTKAALLARGPAEAATQMLAGRPLFAAHASLPWPEEPHLVLWHAITLLREFRGDAHVAALLTAGLDGLDAIVIHAASGSVPPAFLRTTRGWSDEQWELAVEFHRETGWLDPEGDSLSAEGVLLREEIEVATDRGSAAPWTVIGEVGCTELRDLVRPWSRTLADAMFAGLGR